MSFDNGGWQSANTQAGVQSGKGGSYVHEKAIVMGPAAITNHASDLRSRNAAENLSVIISQSAYLMRWANFKSGE